MHAEEEGQRYKIGKFILETRRIVRGGGEWEDGDVTEATDFIIEEEGGVAARGRGGEGEDGRGELEGEIEFDSQDEDECEDLFSGIWSPELARRRRRNKTFRRS